MLYREKVLVSGEKEDDIPRVWAEKINPDDWGLAEEEVAILRRGPEDPDYWATWEYTLEEARFIDEYGMPWTLVLRDEELVMCQEI